MNDVGAHENILLNIVGIKASKAMNILTLQEGISILSRCLIIPLKTFSLTSFDVKPILLDFIKDFPLFSLVVREIPLL